MIDLYDFRNWIPFSWSFPAVQEKLSTSPTELKNFLDMLRLFQIITILFDWRLITNKIFVENI